MTTSPCRASLLFLGGFRGLGYRPLSSVGATGVLRNVQENGFFDRRDYRAQIGLMVYL